jgi:hypothetical protein
MALNSTKKGEPAFNGFILAAMVALLAIILAGCKITYSMSGASISAGVKTASIQYFQNRASIVQPQLSQTITDALIDKCKAQTSLGIVNGLGDVNFEGEISEYSSKPMTVAADAQAATNRFTISVKVKFTNSVDPTYNYEQTFTRYEDYNSSYDLSAVEKDLTQKIVDQLVEDIFNKAFVNW